MDKNDELMHYGVLGMKWGQRRARIANEKSKFHAKRAREDRKDQLYRGANWHTKRSEKLANKAKKIQQKHERLSGGKKVYNRVKNTSTKKLIGQSLIYGTYGALKYHQLRSKDVSIGKSYILSILNNAGNLATSGISSIVEPRISNPKKKK